jgi:hypothetical protein
MPAVNAALENLGFYGMTTCDGMDAVPPSDPCEQALKQFTAMLLNLESNRLQDLCSLDLSEEGCSSTSVGELVDEVAGLIHGGYCMQAKPCVAAVNEGDALTGGSETASGDSGNAPITDATSQADGLVSLGSKSGRQSSCRQPEEPAQRSETLREWLRYFPGLVVMNPQPIRSGPAGGDFILYYNVPRDYTPDDPRVIIMSYADEADEQLDSELNEAADEATAADDERKRTRRQRGRTDRD